MNIKELSFADLWALNQYASKAVDRIAYEGLGGYDYNKMEHLLRASTLELQERTGTRVEIKTDPTYPFDELIKMISEIPQTKESIAPLAKIMIEDKHLYEPAEQRRIQNCLNHWHSIFIK